MSGKGKIQYLEASKAKTSTLTMKNFFTIAVILSSTVWCFSDEPQAALKGGFVCEHPPYKVHLVSKSPLVMYIDDFVTPKERAHLQAITYVFMRATSPVKMQAHKGLEKTRSHTRPSPMTARRPFTACARHNLLH